MGDAVNMATASVRNRLEEIIDSLSEEKLIVLFNLALKVKEGMAITETDEILSAEEVEMMMASEAEYVNGDWVWWRDVKRSDV
ncbi:MAG TPA: hypothetical protein VMW83_01755 [Spirochaetia bacterium]|nr:hypothetical protein [Spirochaetia bacterium]